MTSKSSKDRPLSERRYSSLLSDVQELVSEAEVAAHGEKVAAFWAVGRRIQKERISQQAGYHNSVLRDLAHDVGLGKRNLQRAVAFAEAYASPPKPDGLSWSHYRALLVVPEAKEREQLRQLAIDEGLSARELEAAIRGGALDTDEPYRLQRPTDLRYVYAADVLEIIDADTLDLAIDLGFQTKREQRIRLAAVNAPPGETAEGRQARAFVARHMLRATSLAIKTERVDLHGRYVAHVFHSTRDVTFGECFLHGHYLNDQLLAAGHARVSM